MTNVGDRIAQKAGHTRFFAAVMKRIAPRFDRANYGRFGGRVLGAGPPILLLSTVGNRSGKEHTTPLLYIRSGEDVVVAASNWGESAHPAWSENLLADPRARVRIGEGISDRRARLATPEQREELWPRLLELWPAYATYQERSGRRIRVFILEQAEHPDTDPGQTPA